MLAASAWSFRADFEADLGWTHLGNSLEPLLVSALIDNGNNRPVFIPSSENLEKLLRPGGTSFLLHPRHSEDGIKKNKTNKLLES